MLTNVLLVLVVCLLAGFGYFFFRIIHSVRDTLGAFFEAPDEKTPSPFAQVCQAVGKSVAGEITASVSGMLMGKASQASQALDAIAQETNVAQNPLAGALLSLSPKLRGRLANNPMVLSLIQSAVGGLLNKGTGGGGSSDNGHTKVKFHL